MPLLAGQEDAFAVAASSVEHVSWLDSLDDSEPQPLLRCPDGDVARAVEIAPGASHEDCLVLCADRSERDAVRHLVQDRDTIDHIFSEELPSDQYYEELEEEYLQGQFPRADPYLIKHLISATAAFDTAPAFAMSFGIAKFQLAQVRVKLVGEIVSRDGRSPNPEIVRAIRKWPPVNTLKDLQAFLGTANYVRAHAGPAHSRVASPLRPLLKPGAKFPPNEDQLASIEAIKDLLVEDHTLAVPDEFAAITAANCWLDGGAPGGRPFELAADTSGYAIGGVMGQCAFDGGPLRILGYFSAHLSECQQRGGIPSSKSSGACCVLEEIW